MDSKVEECSLYAVYNLQIIVAWNGLDGLNQNNAKIKCTVDAHR